MTSEAKTQQELEQIYYKVMKVFEEAKLTSGEAFYILALLQSAVLREEMEGVVRTFLYKHMR